MSNLNFCKSKSIDGVTIGTPVPEWIQNLPVTDDQTTGKRKRKPAPVYKAKPEGKPAYINTSRHNFKNR